MSKPHAILIMICIITVSLVWNYHLTQDNKRLELYNDCLSDKLSTEENCFYCDSISKL